MQPWLERPSLAIPLDARGDERLAAITPEIIADVKRLLNFFRGEMPESTRRWARLLNWRTLGRFRHEAQAVADKAGVDWREVLLVNLAYDFVVGGFGCSTIALATPAGPVLARNMDFWPEDLLARASYLIRYTRRNETVFWQAGWPGAIGVVSGLSTRGFAVVLNAVQNPEKLNVLGYPVLLFLRRVVEEASGFDAAVWWLKRTKLTTSALFTVVGRDNSQRVVIERTPRRFAERWPDGNAPLFTTNDYRCLAPSSDVGLGALFETTCRRYQSLQKFFGEHRGERNVSDNEFLYVLTDPTVRQAITAQHVIFRPRDDSARLFVPRIFCQ